MKENKIYIGNLSYDTTEDSARSAFSQFGEITDLVIIKDRDTGRSKGFGFITFASADAVSAAVDGKNGQDLDGRTIKVSEAQDKKRSDGRGGGRR